MVANTQNDINIRVGVIFQGLNKGLNNLQNQLNKFKSSPLKKGEIVGPFSVLEKTVPKVTKTIKNFQARMLGAGLGVMFFGMAIQRAFMGIWQSASKTFTEVMASTTDATNGFTMLEGSLKFLWFTVGEALEPLAMALIPIIDKITDWIQLNPELTRQLVKWGIIIGTTLFFVGQLALGINGVVQAVGLLKGLFMASTWVKFGKILGSIFLSPVTWVILLVAAITAVVIWIAKMSKEMGGFGEFAKSVLRGVLRFVFLLGEGIIWIGSKIVDALIWPLNKAIELINKGVRLYNQLPENLKLLGDLSEVGSIQTIDMQFGTGILDNYFEWEAEKLAPKNGYATGNEGDPLYSAPKNEVKIDTVNIQTDNADQLLAELQRMAQ